MSQQWNLAANAGISFEVFPTIPLPGQELFFSWWDTEWLMPLAVCGMLSSICSSVAIGYIEAAVIPAGARRIRVVEDKPAHSFLGKKTKEKNVLVQNSALFSVKWPLSKWPVRWQVCCCQEAAVDFILVPISLCFPGLVSWCLLDVIVYDNYRPYATWKDQRILLYRQKSSWTELGTGLNIAARSIQHFGREWEREQCI